MRRWSKTRWAVTIFLLLLVSCGLYQRLRAGGPYKGRVIDAETKQPLEGAVVLAVWEKALPSAVQTAYGFLNAEEVLTDSNGRFVVGKHPPMTWIPGAWVEGPNIIIFYPGYGFFPLYHASPPEPLRGTAELLERMEKEELVIELPPLETRAKRIEVQGGVFYLGVPDKKMPNLVRLVNLERRRLGFEPTHTK